MILLAKGWVRGHVRRGLPVRAYLRDAFRYAAERHAGQTRADGKTPYIVHPVRVARVLAHEGGVKDPATVAAALLHDTIEDTGATREDIAARFGDEVAGIVVDLTNPPGMNSDDVKEWQVQHVPGISEKAKHVKIADKIANIRDIENSGWDAGRATRYLDSARNVVHAMGADTHPVLRALFDKEYARMKH